MKSTLKWKQATEVYPTDHIISSKAREIGAIGFQPQYENVKHVNMRFLLSNEYMRLWFKERDLYQKENYSKQEKAQTEAKLRRRYVQRMMTNPKQQTKELPAIQMKRFQNIMSKVDSGKSAEEKTKICERFRKTVEPIVLTRYKTSCPVPKKKNIAQKETKLHQKGDSSEDQDKTSSDQSGKECQFVCKLV